MTEHVPLKNPVHAFKVVEDGTVLVELVAEDGTLHEYTYDDPEYVMGISNNYHQAAWLLSQLMQGVSFEDIALMCGGVDAQTVISTEDILREGEK